MAEQVNADAVIEATIEEGGDPFTVLLAASDAALPKQVFVTGRMHMRMSAHLEARVRRLESAVFEEVDTEVVESEQGRG